MHRFFFSVIGRDWPKLNTRPHGIFTISMVSTEVEYVLVVIAINIGLSVVAYACHVLRRRCCGNEERRALVYIV